MNVANKSVSVAWFGSLRLRLLLGTLVWIVLSIFIAGWALGGLFRQHVAQQFHAELNTHLDQLVAHLSVDSNGKLSLPIALSDPRFSKPYSGLYWQVDASGAKSGQLSSLLRSRSLWDDALKLPDDTLMNGDIHQHRILGPGNTQLGVIERFISLEDAPDNTERKYRLVVAADERQMLEPVDRFNNMLWMTLGLLGTGLVLVAVSQVLIALVPLRRLHGALAAVRSGGTLRLEGHFPQEVQPLVEEFNSVLAQNADVVERARIQTGNLAHALKTPLSVIANVVDGKEDELAQGVASQVAIARKQIDYHLSRARVAASVRLPGACTPLDPVLEGLVRVMKRIYAERNIDFTIHAFRRPILFRGEEQDLQEMIGNLLDNASKWAAQQIHVYADRVGNEFQLTIEDDGCGIEEAERRRVLVRGERADEQVTGSGLGLAIVNDLARLYGGRIELASSSLGGLRVLLLLPAIGENENSITNMSTASTK